MQLSADIEFGSKYRDRNTGFEGTATAVYFFEFGCTRVNLATLKDGEIKEAVFDEQALVRVADEEPVRAHARAGGTRPGPSGTTGSIR